ncbi:MAG: thiamine-phosphate kinase [Negativicutes bacterium]|nr:thiamine-phosphate kinase [Negativicutes bacterium]
MKINEIGEFGLIDILKQNTINNKDNIIKGIGDDAAVFSVENNLLQLATTDMLVEGIHFNREFITAWQLGYKAIAVNFSDIAAMGGTPTNILISLAIPSDIDVDFMVQLYDGMKYLTKKFNANIIGGDTVASLQGLVINVTVLGTVPLPLVKYRSGAKNGDLVVVTGDLGSSAAGLEILLNKYEQEQYEILVKKHLMPFPQLNYGEIIANYANSMNDISDGLASEANEISTASEVGIMLKENKMPVLKETKEVAKVFQKDVLDYVLFGGEDYQLVFTITPEKLTKLQGELNDLTIVGEVCSSFNGVKLERNDGTIIDIKSKGYNHFR